jgi:uncharacterized membrane protein
LERGREKWRDVFTSWGVKRRCQASVYFNAGGAPLEFCSKHCCCHDLFTIATLILISEVAITAAAAAAVIIIIIVVVVVVVIVAAAAATATHSEQQFKQRPML